MLQKLNRNFQDRVLNYSHENVDSLIKHYQQLKYTMAFSRTTTTTSSKVGGTRTTGTRTRDSRFTKGKSTADIPNRYRNLPFLTKKLKDSLSKDGKC